MMMMMIMMMASHVVGLKLREIYLRLSVFATLLWYRSGMGLMDKSKLSLLIIWYDHFG